MTRRILLSSLLSTQHLPGQKPRAASEREIVGSSKPEVPITLVCLCFSPWAVSATAYSTDLPVCWIWLIIWDLVYPFPALFKTTKRTEEAPGEA